MRDRHVRANQPDMTALKDPYDIGRLDASGKGQKVTANPIVAPKPTTQGSIYYFIKPY